MYKYTYSHYNTLWIRQKLVSPGEVSLLKRDLVLKPLHLEIIVLIYVKTAGLVFNIVFPIHSVTNDFGDISLPNV